MSRSLGVDFERDPEDLRSMAKRWAKTYGEITSVPGESEAKLFLQYAGKSLCEALFWIKKYDEVDTDEKVCNICGGYCSHEEDCTCGSNATGEK